MKTKLFIVALLAALLSACQPAAPDFSGRWTTSASILTLNQEGDKVTGTVEGYGGFWNFAVSGTVSGSTLTFEGGDASLPSLPAIVLSEDGQTLHSADPNGSFCGTRAESLPEGCGYSGTWKLKADFLPAGSIAKLTQSGATVTGAVYGPDGAVLAQVKADLTWSKGKYASGINEWGEFTIRLATDELSIELIVPGQPGWSDMGSPQWCGIREGLTSVFTGAFECAIP
ncbi:MAG: hypothetical protein AB1750_01600 [Chloroflexota bacterium]